MNRIYHQQVDLLLRVLPHAAAEPSFALKGGTAINLFVRNMPRLSVDIDLTYLPVEERSASAAAVKAALGRIDEAVTAAEPGVRVTSTSPGKIVAQTPSAVVKVEVSPVLRGRIFAVRELELCEEAQDAFGRFVVSPVVSEAELFAGKLVAALDRQHPRDLFDTAFILDRVGDGPIGTELQAAFLAMLLSSKRPPHELLDPREQDRTAAHAGQFDGMAREPFSLADHRVTFSLLRQRLPSLLGPVEREALVAAVAGEAGWHAHGNPVLPTLPAVRWKLRNLEKLKRESPRKHGAAVAELERVLGSW